MATTPDYYIETFDTGIRPHPWRWELRRRSQPMGIRFGAGGFQSQPAAEHAGKRALERFIEMQLSDEIRALRAEARCLPPGDLRDYVEGVAKYAEVLLCEMRRD